MTRALYQGLIWLHPPAFRQRFSEKLLWIFDEVAAKSAVFPLFADGIISLARQWLIRHGTWKWAAAAVGGLLETIILLALLNRESPPLGR